jgi:hypothetical protein
MTDTGRAARVAFIDRWSAELADLATGDLTPDERIDAEFLQTELAAHRFAELELREESWSPLEWVYMLGEGIFALIAREFAPLAERLASVAGRLEGCPRCSPPPGPPSWASMAGRSIACTRRRRSRSSPGSLS